MAELGDVISIPFGNQIATGKIIYRSTLIKNVFGFIVLPTIFKQSETVTVIDGPHIKIKLPSLSFEVLYADIKAVTKRKKWPVIGNLALTSDDEALLLHAVGGTLYQGNEKVKVFDSIEEGKAYPQILSSGDIAVENILKCMLNPH